MSKRLNIEPRPYGPEQIEAKPAPLITNGAGTFPGYLFPAISLKNASPAAWVSCGVMSFLWVAIVH